MANLPPSERSQLWSTEALALAAQAKVLAGSKLEQLVVRLQRHTGRPSERCWRFVIQYGIKGKVGHRRWTDEEVDFVREEILKRSVDEIAMKLGRTPKSVRSMLLRNRLGVREIRCDQFSLESLARALHIRKEEIRFWIQQGWLQASVSTNGRRRSYTITSEALAQAYKHHLADLLKRGTPNQSLFEAYVQYVHSPKHTVGGQLLDVRRDKRERAAYAALHGTGGKEQIQREDDENEEPGEDYCIGICQAPELQEDGSASSE